MKKRKILFVIMAFMLMAYSSSEVRAEKVANSKNTEEAGEIMEKMREKYRRREEERIEAEKREAERKIEEQKAEEKRQKEEAERLAQEEKERYKNLPLSEKMQYKVNNAMSEVDGMVQIAENARQEEIENEKSIEEIKELLNEETEQMDEVGEEKEKNMKEEK